MSQPNPDSFPGPSPQRSLQAGVTTCISGPPATLWATGLSALFSVASHLPRAGVPCMSQHLHLPRLSSPFQAQGGGHFCDGIPRMFGLAINSSFLRIHFILFILLYWSCSALVMIVYTQARLEKWFCSMCSDLPQSSRMFLYTLAVQK